MTNKQLKKVQTSHQANNNQQHSLANNKKTTQNPIKMSLPSKRIKHKPIKISQTNNHQKIIQEEECQEVVVAVVIVRYL